MTKRSGSSEIPIIGWQGSKASGTPSGAPANFQFSVVRSFPDNPDLFLHMVQFPQPGVQWVTMSLLNMDPQGSARIIHQVTNRQIPNNNPDISRVAGTKVIDFDEDTEETRGVARKFVEQVFLSGDPKACRDWLDAERFITHNPFMEPDSKGFEAFISSEMSRPDPLRYVCVSDVVAYHDFAAVFSLIDFRGQEYRACDLVRVQDGKIVEHWDIAEPADNQAPAGNDRSFLPR